MIENKCSYRGIKLGIQPGDKICCPLCDATLVAIERNGRAWLPAHDRKIPINVWHYHHSHSKGAV